MRIATHCGLGVALFLASCAATPPPEPEPAFRIGIIGDQTGVSDLDAAYRILAEGVDVMNALEPDIVLHTGDLLESAASEEEIRNQWRRARAHLDRLDADWMIVPGDHDVNPPERVAASQDRSREALFRTLSADANPHATHGLYFAQDTEGVRIIGLNAHETLHADPRWGNVFLAALSPTQIRWLEQALSAPPQPRATVVFVHQPLWYNTVGWAPVHGLLADHGVDLVIAGHVHYDQIEAPRDGVTYMTVGATGGRIKSGDPAAGATHHVTLIEIDRTGAFAIELVPLDETDGDIGPTPRAVMDRIQALDVMLGGVVYSPDRRPVIRGSAQGCMLALPQFGAPLDVPVTLTVSLGSQDPGVSLSEGRFREGACETTPDSSTCVMPPSYGVISANTSSVRVAPAATPFWQGRIRGTAAPQATATLRIEASFTVDDQRYWLTAEPELDLGPCAPD